jgi:5-methylcytosine-specific restriction protein A
MPNKPRAHRSSWQRSSQAEYDRRRGPDRQFYSTPRWKAFRRVFLQLFPLCVECEREGRLTLATDVDHIRPRKDLPYDDWYAIEACQGLCKSHHSRKTRKGQ